MAALPPPMITTWSAGWLLVAQVHLAQKRNDIVDLGKIVFPFDLQLVAQMGPDPQEEGLIAFAAAVPPG